MIAWLITRQRHGRFLLRMEDLTTGRRSSTEDHQIADMTSLGIDFDGEPIRQSDRLDLYGKVIDDLVDRGLTYECFCSRREIRDAGVAPHGPTGSYPGTCRDLDAMTVDMRRAQLADQGRAPALRLRADAASVSFTDHLSGVHRSVVDDFVLRRGDGLVAYNLAVVVDDADSDVDHVVRGDDLLESTSRQVLLQRLLGFTTPEYIHVPLVLGPDGARLSKRHGSVGLDDQIAAGATPGAVRAWIARSIGIDNGSTAITTAEMLERFELSAVPREQVVLDPSELVW